MFVDSLSRDPVCCGPAPEEQPAVSTVPMSTGERRAIILRTVTFVMTPNLQHAVKRAGFAWITMRALDCVLSRHSGRSVPCIARRPAEDRPYLPQVAACLEPLDHRTVSPEDLTQDSGQSLVRYNL